MQKTLTALLISTAVLLASLVASIAYGQEPAAAGNAQRGAVLSNTCMGCHGIASYRNAYPSYRVPKLGGQHADYVVLALQGYKNQTRPHKTMHAQAVSMTDQDMRDVAAFFASEGSIEPKPAAGAPAPAKAATCAACHGEVGVSAAPNWPSLAGQHRDYIEHALGEYKGGLRKDPIMGGQAAGLEPKDIRELAAYFAAQPGLFTVHYNN